jgi:hypothetical protein
MWARLVAGVAAHDVNNAAQGLANLLTLAARPGTSRETLERYAALARDGLADLKRLAGTLRAVAAGDEELGPHRLDFTCTDAVTETAVPEGRTVEVDALPVDVFVQGTRQGPRLAVSLLLRHCLAASALGGAVRVGIAREPGGAAVVIEAPQAPALPTTAERPLSELVGHPDRPLGVEGGLILAGALASGSGGEIRASSPQGKGQRFKLRLPLAEEGAENARSA